MSTDRDDDKPVTIGDLRAALAERAQLRKNGETWKDYVFRVVTLDRIALAIVLLYQLSGNVHEAQRQLETATTTAAAASQTAAIASQRADEAARKTEALAKTMEGVVSDLKQQSTLNGELRDRVEQTVTRGEFFSVIGQTVMPPIKRLEQRRTGEGR